MTKQFMAKLVTKIHPKGETLIEVLVALIALMISGAAAASLLISALNMTGFSKDYLIAQNLAAEAVEGIRNILDTNELLYVDNPDCWKALQPDTTDLLDCGQTMQAGEFYNISFNETLKLWQMEEQTSEIDSTNLSVSSNDVYKLYRHELTDGTCIYSHNSAAEDLCNEPLPSPDFYRQIQIMDVDDLSKEVIAVISVKWLDGSSVSNFETAPTQIKKE